MRGWRVRVRFGVLAAIVLAAASGSISPAGAHRVAAGKPGKTLVGHVTLVTALAPGAHDSSRPAPDGLRVDLIEVTQRLTESPAGVNYRYLKSLAVSGRIGDSETTTQGGGYRLTSPISSSGTFYVIVWNGAGTLIGSSLVPRSALTSAGATSTVDVVAFEHTWLGPTFLVSGLVVLPAGRRIAQGTTLTVETTGSPREAETGSAPGAYRLILRRTLETDGSHRMVYDTLTLIENGKAIDTAAPATTSHNCPAFLSFDCVVPVEMQSLFIGGTSQAGSTTAGAKLGGKGWMATAATFSTVGQRYLYDCPAGGTVEQVWGLKTYTSDSSVCTAAVQQGLIGLAQGGDVQIEMKPGEDSYGGANQDGITSLGYGRWSASFVLLGVPHFPTTKIGYGGDTWDATAVNGKPSQSYQYICPKNGTAAEVTGTNTYDGDSSVCTAAVHFGLITLVQGGTVVIKVQPGSAPYTASTRNGITSDSWQSNDGPSFSFVPR